MVLLLIFLLLSNCGNNQTKKERSYSYSLGLIKEIPLKGALLSGAHRMVKVGDQFRILDTKNNKVYVFSEEGELVNEFGSAGNGQGQLNFPVSLATDDTGTNYIFDTYLKRVVVFDNNGSFKRTIDVDTGGSQMIVQNDHIYFFDPTVYNDNRPMVSVYDAKTGEQIKTISPASDMMQKFNRGFSGSAIMGLAVSDEKLVTLQHTMQLRIRTYSTSNNEMLNEHNLQSDFFQKVNMEKYRELEVNMGEITNAFITGFFAGEGKVYVLYTEIGTAEKFMDVFSMEGNLLNREPIALGDKWPRYHSEEGYFYSFAWADSANHDSSKATVALRKYELKKTAVQKDSAR